ncbi:heme/hemin ABC transporter substrate-binding protein [Shimia biformata]|uniref:heme/hemin ABC transporter substrate-binding protein n=1 Tax=Shimia biformata TaxID=1294299 RepID=UPI0019511ACD|nr:ABC transporter substrate-binding protein [Shimia biformata]
MNRLSPLSWLQVGLIGLLLAVAGGRLALAEPAMRIVSVGGSVTEIVYALGQEHRLVARDTTSSFPPEAAELPDIGYIRRLSPEGVLSVNPDLILTEEGAGPPEAIELLKQAGVPVVEVPLGFDRAAVTAKITTVADALGVAEKGELLAAEVDARIGKAQEMTDGLTGKRVMFILSLQGGRVLTAGSDTAAQGIIELAGATNAVQGMSGYKPLSDEAVLAANPDVLLVMANGGRMALSDDDILRHPAIALTPAGQKARLVRMDGMLMLGFSVRTGQAVTELSAALRDAGS